MAARAYWKGSLKLSEYRITRWSLSLGSPKARPTWDRKAS
jgi:hypothetical protein